MAYGVVYGLYDPRTDELRYIGQTVRTLRQRLAAHLKDCKRAKTWCARWLRTLDASPSIRSLGEAFSETELDALEIRLIAEARSQGLRLTNVAAGGGGTSGHTHSEDAKRKMSLARRGRPKSQETRTKMAESYWSNPLSDEAKQKISEAQAGKPKSPEHRKKLSDSLKGKSPGRRSAETRARMSLAAKKRETQKREASHG